LENWGLEDFNLTLLTKMRTWKGKLFSQKASESEKHYDNSKCEKLLKKFIQIAQKRLNAFLES